jgi:hypothetical protein
MNMRELREHKNAVSSFQTAYAAYLDATRSNTPPSAEEQSRLRAEAVRLMPAAHAALTFAGISPVMYPLSGGSPVSGLTMLAFAHEDPMFALTPTLPQQVVDALDAGASQLEMKERHLRRERRNPLYWGDRILGAVLGFPAYLLSLIFRVPPSKIEESVWGTLLRFVTFVSGVLSIYFGGHAAGWW